MSGSTPPPGGAQAAADHALRALARGEAGDSALRATGVVGGALPVYAPDGQWHGWFVPIAVKDRLVGFFEYTTSLTLVRFSSFQRAPGRFADCPSLADWTEPVQVQQRARDLAFRGEAVGEPRLSYDTVPDRLAWAVPLRRSDGRERVIFVAGTEAYASGGATDGRGGIGGAGLT